MKLKYRSQQNRRHIREDVYDIPVGGALMGLRITSVELDSIDVEKLGRLRQDALAEFISHLSTKFAPPEEGS